MEARHEAGDEAGSAAPPAWQPSTARTSMWARGSVGWTRYRARTWPGLRQVICCDGNSRNIRPWSGYIIML